MIKMLWHKTLEKIALIAFGVVIFAGAIFNPIGCGSPPGDLFPPQKTPTEDIAQLEKDLGSTKNDLEVTTKTIKENATEGAAKTPPVAQPLLYPYWTNILSAVGVQEQLVKNLDAMQQRAESAEKKSVEFENSYNKEATARRSAEDSSTKELKQKYLAYSGVLFMASLVLFGIAVWSGGNKLLLWGGVVAGAGSAACIFIIQTVALIPWIVGGSAIVALIFLVYTFKTKSKEMNGKSKEIEKKSSENKVLDTAAKELVETLEAAKPRMTLAGRVKVFGDGPGKGDAFAIQSKATEALVKEIRKTIENAPKLLATVATDWNRDGVIDDRDIPPIPANITAPRKRPFVLS